MKFFSQILLLIAILILASCRRDKFYEGQISLQFSNDTVFFDTIFSTVGSVTLTLKVFNPHDGDVLINNIGLASAGSSDFSLNIDGLTQKSMSNIILRAHDSIYIFVSANITLGKNLLKEEDILYFVTGTHQQNVLLLAWGRDVHRLNTWICDKDTTLAADLPYLILGDITVKAGITLTLDAGVEMFFHRNTGMNVQGKLIVNGTFLEPIIIRSDRLENDYNDVPGQWNGITLMNPVDTSSIDFAEIKHAITGIRVGSYEPFESHPNLIIRNSKIEYMSYAGIRSTGGNIKMSNCVIADCGYYALLTECGGDVQVNHSTFANYYDYGSRLEPSMSFNNQALFNGSIINYPLNVKVTNSIIYGENTHELRLARDAAGMAFNYVFDHCLIKANVSELSLSDTNLYKDVIINQDPKFKDEIENNFEIDSLSPAKDKGKPLYGFLLPLDIVLNDRMADLLPDLGAYENIK